MPNWSKARGESRAHSFGGELALALPSAQSLARNALRCGITLNPSELIDGFKKGSSSGFDAALAHYGSVPDGLDRRTLYDVIRTQRRYSTGITGGDLDSFEIGRIKPSPLLYRESIQSSIELMLSEFNFDEALTASVVGDFVDRYIGKIKSALLVG